MKYIKTKKSGITLIALVVTIVILIILAGVTINLVIGENGILSKAKEARRNYIEAAENEKTKLDQIEEVLNQTDEMSDNETDGTTTPPEEKIVVTLNKTSTEILVANTDTLIATIESDNENNKTVNWKSSNEKIATVNENGVVTGVSSGITTIIATTEEGEKTATCLVEVRNIENTIPYDDAPQISTIFNKAKELGYVTTYNTLVDEFFITAPVTEYSIAFYEFICKDQDQDQDSPIMRYALDYETCIQGPPGSNQWWSMVLKTNFDVDYERYYGYLGPKTLQNGETKFGARARVSPNTPFCELEQICTFNIQIVSQTDFLNAAQELGINNAMELIYSTFEEYGWEELEKLAEAISNDETITRDTPKVSKVVDGKTYELEVGDMTKVIYNGEEKRVRIIGFNHDTLTDIAAYGKGKENTYAGISFQFLDFIMEESMIGLENKLNSEIELNKLGNISQIKQVNKAHLLGSKSETTQIRQDKIWLLSLSEEGHYSQYNDYKNQFETDIYSKEGNIYKYYKDIEYGLLDYCPSSYSWWTRSPYDETGSKFCTRWKSYVFGLSVDNIQYVMPGFAI